MSEHFTLDELAELDAGLLAHRRARAAARHLARCDECQARAAAIGRTKDALRDLGPAQMPADVAARLARALDDATTTTGEDVVPDLGAYRAKRFGGIPPWAYAAAAAVVVLGATGIAVGTRHGHKATPTSAAAAPLVPTAAASAQRLRVPLQESGRTYTPDSIAHLATGLIGNAAAADTLAAKTPEFAGTQGGAAAGGGSAGNAAGHPRAAKNGVETRQPDTGAVPAPAGVAPAPSVATATSRIPASLRRLADSRSALLQCAAFISDTPNASPIAVDFGRWTNADAGLRRVPAVVFVFDDLTDPHSIDVFVVGAACDDTSLLDYQILDRTP